MSRSLVRVVLLTLVSLPVLVCAQSTAPATAPAHPFASPDVVAALPAGGVGSIGQVTLALIVVLGAVFGVAWLIRRLRGLALGGTQTIEIVAQVGLGARERAVLVRVGGAQVLLGVAPGRVNALHVLPADAVLPPAPLAVDAVSATHRPSFATLLKKSFGR